MNAAAFLPLEVVFTQTKRCAGIPRDAAPRGRHRRLPGRVADRILPLLVTVAWAINVRPASSQGLDLGFDPDVNGSVLAVTVQTDGNILIGGVFTSVDGVPRVNIARLTADGGVDLAFDSGAQYSALVRNFITQPDGKIVVAGMFVQTLGGQPCTNIVRLHPDGRGDASFQASLEYRSCIPDPCPFAQHGLAAQGDGKILVCGSFDRVNGQVRSSLARLHADGSLDTGFTANASPNDVRSVAVQADGKIVVGGGFRTLNGLPVTNLCRLNPDGSVDPDFTCSANGYVFALAVQADGRILVGGNFTALGGQPRTHLGRLLADGRVDPGFAPEVIYASGDNYPAVWSLALQTDGRILVGGAFTNLAGAPRTHLGRLLPDGSADPSFNPSVTGVSVSSMSVLALAVQPDGHVLAGGGFTGLDGRVRHRLGRFTTGTAARQSLAISADGAAATWRRTGSGPEVEHVMFEASWDGANYTTLGTATRMSGGWERAGLSLPGGQTFHLRARGRATGGMFNGCGSLVESVGQFYLPPRITHVAGLADGLLTLRGAGPATQPCVLLTASSLLPPPAWSPIATNIADANGLVTFLDLIATHSPTRFYQLRWP